MELNPGLHGDRLVTNHLSHGTGLFQSPVAQLLQCCNNVGINMESGFAMQQHSPLEQLS
jgi:hypothetical protein